MIGTLTGAHTTPESPELQARLAEFVAEGSHGRGDGGVVARARRSSASPAATSTSPCSPTSVATTSICTARRSAYFAAKAALFQPELAARAVVNIDDPHGRLLLAVGAVPTEAFSLDDVDDVCASAVDQPPLPLARPARSRSPIGGRFNVMNSLAAATACAALGHRPGDDRRRAARRAARCRAGSRRCVAGQPFAVIVDYAHTPDGLERRSPRPARSGFAGRGASSCSAAAAIAIAGKRPVMGAVAATLADHVVITSDNPRSEDPLAIISAIVEGVAPDYRGRVVIEPDRRRAIAIAVRRGPSG